MKTAAEEIVKALKKIVEELGWPDIEPTVERPIDPEHGDYSTNIALKLNPSTLLRARTKNSKLQLKTQKYENPLELAQEIVKIFNTKYKIPNTDRIEAAVPGFINFHLSKDYLVSQLASQGLTLRGKKGEKIMVEFTDPNPFKEFHIGHLYSNTVGESVCRLLEAQGAEVKRANYQGDVGMHVAKAIYGLLRELKTQNSRLRQGFGGQAKLDEKTLVERIKILGEAYALGAAAYEKDETAKKEINELNKKVYQKNPEVMSIYNKGRQWSLDYFETIYKRLGTRFDFYYFESEVGKIGLELVKQYLKKPFDPSTLRPFDPSTKLRAQGSGLRAQGKGVFEESEGAIVFPGKQFGLHTRVFINSQGFPTYEAKELGLAPKKYEDFPYDQSIIVTGNEIIEYFRVLLSALSKIRPDLAAKTKHLPHGMVRLKNVKMSSRTGEVVTGMWLLDETKRKIKQMFTSIKEEVAEIVAVGAVKYALLKSSIGRDIVFDFEESISLTGNSGPYLQYTYARTQSVLAKLKAHPPAGGSKLKATAQKLKLDYELNAEELALLRLVYRLPEIVEEASQKFAPNLVCNYLYDLSQAFNLFYQKHKILGSEAADFRLSLTLATGQTLKRGLYLLGISAPQHM